MTETRWCALPATSQTGAAAGVSPVRRGTYLDHGATTPVDATVLAAMMPFLTDDFGNASSGTHAYGWTARTAVEGARAAVAGLIGADTSEVLFTSGATESNYLAIVGAVRGLAQGGVGHIVTSQIEHKSVLEACRGLAREGIAVTELAPAEDGRITATSVEQALRSDTILVSLMLVNNEIGTINPIAEIAAILRPRGIILHCDAAQAIGRIPVDVAALGADLVSITAHKLYGPKGVGALCVRGNLRQRMRAIIAGGGQEGGLRGGTLNVPGIVGLGAASRRAQETLASEVPRLMGLRARLLARLEAALPGMRVNGSLEHRAPGNLSVSFADVEGDALLKKVGEEIAVSSGAACAAGGRDISHVLAALGLPVPLARATLRFGLGKDNTEDDVDHAAEVVIRVVSSLRRDTLRVVEGTGARAPRVSADGISLAPIGVVRNHVREPQYIAWKKVRSVIEIASAFATALTRLEDHSHIVVVYWMHGVQDQKLLHVPQSLYADVPEVGILASRCPYRPNPIAVTTVKLLGVDGTRLFVEGLDAVDDSPVLDIKPHTPQLDEAAGEVRIPEWVGRLVY